MIKRSALKPEININCTRIGKLCGIIPEVLTTIGSVELTIRGTIFRFHVVNDSFPIASDGILGRNYMKAELAIFLVLLQHPSGSK